MSVQEYPKSMHKGAEVRTVNSKEEQEALGPNWVDGNEYFTKQVKAEDKALADQAKKSEPKSEPKPEQKPEPKSEPKPESKPEQKPEAKPEPKP